MRIKLIKYKEIYQWGCSCLIHTPLKQIAQILSHGGVHLLLFIALFFLILKLFKLSTTEVGPQYHEIQISIKDKLTNISISAQIASDSVFSEYGYSQKIDVRYMLADKDISNTDFNRKFPYSTTIDVSRYPYLSKWEFSDNIQNLDLNDTIYFEDYAYKLNKKCDSTLNVDIFNGYIYGVCDSFPKPQQFSIVGDELLSPSINSNNPYYYFYMRLDFNTAVDDVNAINIIIGDFARNGADVRQDRPLRIQYIFPEPDMVTSGAFMYSSPQAIQRVIANRGIIVQAEDIALKNKGDKESFIYAILLGAIVAFWIDVFVNLIIKLRNFNNRINI